jgi:hydrogenase expression/formation protein HypC
MCLAVPMKVAEIFQDNTAAVSSGEISLTISLQLVEKPKVGDYLIVHAGYALEVLNIDHANEMIRSLKELSLNQ